MEIDLMKRRIEMGFTREQLSKKLGCNKQQVYNFELGGRPVPIKHLPKLARALEVRESDLLRFVFNRKMKLLEAKLEKLRKAAK